MSLLRQSVHALKWSVLGELGARVLGPLTFVVLARVLLPTDFGVVAAATVVVSLAQVLCELGLAKALVQRRDRVSDAATTAFWMNAVFGVLMTALAWVLAPAVAHFFGDSQIGLALRALSPVMLLSALTAVPMALLQREFRFKTLFWSRLVGAAIPAMVGIPLALAGGGFWALVAGTLAGQMMQATVLWAVGGWRPALSFDRGLAAELLGFGRWALLAGLLGWGFAWLDAVIVGRYLGAHEMGLYRTGGALVTLLFGLVFAPLLPVLYSLFSRAQQDLPLLRSSLLVVVRLSTLILLPMVMLAYALRDVLASGLLGAQWQEAGQVIAVLAMVQGVSWLVSFNGELYRAVGRPLAEVIAMGPMLILYVIVYLLAVGHGLEVFLWCRLALTVLGVAAQVVVAWRVVQIAPRLWIRPLAAVFGGLVLTAVLPGPWWTDLLIALAVSGILCWTEWPLIRQQQCRWRAKTTPSMNQPAPSGEGVA
jgi:O-antigen/teichoic acid export membrane protein